MISSIKFRQESAVTRVLMVVALSLILYACGVSESEMQQQIQKDLQTEVDTDSTLREFDLKVLRVELIKSGSNTFDGVGVVAFRGIEEKIPLKVTRDGSKYMYTTEPLAFAFVAKAALEDPNSVYDLAAASVDRIRGTPEGAAAASELGFEYTLPFFRPSIDREGNVFLDRSLIGTGESSESLIAMSARLKIAVAREPSKEWRILVQSDTGWRDVNALLEGLRAAGVEDVTFTAPTDSYLPPRVELGLECEKEVLPKATRAICMDGELQAKLYRERQCCFVEDPNPKERASPPVALAGTSIAEAEMPVWEVDFDGTILHAGATMAGTAKIGAALRDSRGKSVVLRVNKRAGFKDVAPLFKAAKDAGVGRIYIVGESADSGTAQVPDADEGTTAATDPGANERTRAGNAVSPSTDDSSPPVAANSVSSNAGTHSAIDGEPNVQVSGQVAFVITPPSTQGPGARISRPEYPAASRRAGEAGVVVLKAYVLESGKVGEVGVDRSSGFQKLDESAVREVRTNWQFVPGTQDGVQTPMWHTFSLTFRVDN